MTVGSAPPEFDDVVSSEPGFEFAAWSPQGGGPGNLAVGMMTIRQAEIPRAIEQLDDVVRGTECAANRIMDACAALETLAEEMGGDASDRISDALTMIYEACGFQDLAGQRVTNVTKTLGIIEGKLSDLTTQFGILAGDYHNAPEPVAVDDGGSLTNVRLSGPQHPEDATDQAAVDHLFAQAQ